MATSAESGAICRGALQRFERRSELALLQIKDRQIQQQREIIRREAERFAVMINRAGGVALAFQKLCGGVMRGGYFFDGERRVRTSVRLYLRDIAEVNSVVVDHEARDVVIPAHRIHVRRGNRRFAGSAGSCRVAKAVAINARDDGFRDGHRAGGSFVADTVTIFGNGGGDDPPAVLQHDGIGGRRRHDQ